MRRFWLILVALLGLGATALPAAADVTYTLDCNSVACGTQTNYGSVTLHQVGSGSSASVTVTVDLTTASATETFVGTGAGYAINWNISGNPNLTVTNIAPNGGGQFALQNNAAANHTYKASPFGSSWMYAIDYTINGSNGTDNKLTFDVTKSGGLLLSAFAATSDGFYFASDIFRDNRTFVVASNTHTYVPEPGTVQMILAGLGSLFMLHQRRRKLVCAV